jgi:hypothetical protein
MPKACEHGLSLSECFTCASPKHGQHQRAADDEITRLRAEVEALQKTQLTVRLTSFPETNGRRNWTALLVRKQPWDGLIGNCGGITVAHGELWNRVAYEAERAKFLIGERPDEPFILDYGDDIETPEQWQGEVRTKARAAIAKEEAGNA